jgi:CTP synthase
MSKNTKYIFITGGVVSSLGKGIASASMGNLLESSGKKITFIKLDPYINLDPGTMSPFQHGEVFVTDDGAETDLDLGHYERFTNVRLSQNNNITSGRVYSKVISKERKGDYLGATVQVIPHITNQIQDMIKDATKDVDIALIEVGGTVGDIESLPFLEAIRQLRVELGVANSLFIHLTFVPYIKASKEVKTKPTQHSVKELRSIGIQPDMLMCRAAEALNDKQKSKISLFTNVHKANVFSLVDVENIYDIPTVLYNQHWLDRLSLFWPNLNLKANITNWQSLFVDSLKREKVVVAIIGKYSGLTDAYKSILEAIYHAGIKLKLDVKIEYIDAEELEQNGVSVLSSVNAILVPGGFGNRGIEGKILAVQYARENKVPFFGICLGMQVAVIEFARNCANIEMANSTEFDKSTQNPVIALISEWLSREGKIESRNLDSDIGGTMRLGLQGSTLVAGTCVAKIYNSLSIEERHRHRYEVNESYVSSLERAGLIVSGRALKDDLVEIIEINDHPWFIGCQFHPEFVSRPFEPHALFVSFLESSYEHKKLMCHKINKEDNCVKP